MMRPPPAIVEDSATLDMSGYCARPIFDLCLASVQGVSHAGRLSMVEEFPAMGWISTRQECDRACSAQTATLNLKTGEVGWHRDRPSRSSVDGLGSVY